VPGLFCSQCAVCFPSISLSVCWSRRCNSYKRPLLSDTVSVPSHAACRLVCPSVRVYLCVCPCDRVTCAVSSVASALRVRSTWLKSTRLGAFAVSAWVTAGTATVPPTTGLRFDQNYMHILLFYSRFRDGLDNSPAVIIITVQIFPSD